MNDRLYRSVDDRVLAGVAGGLAERMGLDPAIVRIVWALLALASGGVFIVIYVVMAIAVPEEDAAPIFPPMPGSVPPPAGNASAAGSPTPTSGWGQPAQPGVAQLRSQARAERRAARRALRGEREGRGALVLGVILILVGAWFLVREYIPAFELNRFWPFAILLLGLVLLVVSFGGRRGGEGGS